MSNLELYVGAFLALCSVLAGLFELVGWTKASKVAGTVAALDLGRIVRHVRLGREAYRAVVGSLLVTIALGCSAPAQDARTGLSDLRQVQPRRALDIARGVLAMTDEALSVAIETDKDYESYAPYVLRLQSAQKILSETEAGLVQVCQALPIIGPVAEGVSCEKCATMARAAEQILCSEEGSFQ